MRRVRVPLELEEALAFARQHPVGHLDEPTRRRLLTQLTSAPAGTIVLADARGALTLVATVVDVIADPEAPAHLAMLGALPSIAGAVFAGEVLAPARAFARAVGRRRLQVDRPAFVRDIDEVLARAELTLVQETLAMKRQGARVDAAPPPLPSGWRWAPLDDALVEPVHAALDEIFRGTPTATLPALEAFRAGAFLSPPGWHALLDEGDEVAGAVRLSAEGTRGEVRVLGRRARHRGRALGAALLDRGLRVLAEAGVDDVTLEVAAENQPAIALYRAFDFTVFERTPVYEGRL